MNRFFWPDRCATSQVLTSLTRLLEKEPYRVEVLTSRLDYESGRREYPANDRMGHVHIHRLWTSGFGRSNPLGRMLDYLSFYWAVFVYLLIRSRPGDVVVMKTDPPLLSVLGMVVKWVVPIRLVSWCQDVFPEIALAEMRLPRVLAGLVARLVEVRDSSLRCSDRIVVLGSDMQGFLEQRSISADRISIITNWSVQTAGTEAESAADLRKQWGIEADHCVIGYCGNLGRVHDFETMLGAARILQATAALKFLFIGGGHYLGDFKHRVSELGLGGRFIFRPYQPIGRLDACLRLVDIHWFSLKHHLTGFVYPSKFSGILAAGRPVCFIGDPDSEIAALIRSRRLGIVVEPGHAESLAAQLKQLCTDPGARMQMGQHSRAVWAVHFSPENGRRKWSQLLKTVCRNPASQP